MERKKRPPDHESVFEITKRYANIEGKLRTVIFDVKDINLARQQERIEAATRAAKLALTSANKRFADSLDGAYKIGADRVQNAANLAHGVSNVGEVGDSRTNSRANNTGGGGAFKAVRRGAFIDLQNGMQGALSALRAEVAKTLRGLDDKNRNISEFTNAIKQKLGDGGLLEVKYENGAHIGLEHYAKMLARSSRIETENLGSFERAAELGSDLVKCIGQSPTCELCATFRDRVFSVSGKDKRFPSLYETALKDGYHTIHPNCRCEFMPYFESLEGKAQVEQDKAYSSRPFADNRTKRERDEYASWQAGNRQLWAEQTEYESLKKTFGDDMPYKTLGGFRRARRSGAAEYKKFHYVKSDTQRFEVFKAIIGNDAPDTLDKFQEMKYNNPTQYESLKDYKNAIEGGRISPLAGFKLYEETKHEVADKLFGVTASNSVKIQSQSKHFVERVLGSVEQRRNGVAVDDIAECLKKGKGLMPKIDSKGRYSYCFVIKDVCKVTFNAEGNLIQVNPFTRS